MLRRQEQASDRGALPPRGRARVLACLAWVLLVAMGRPAFARTSARLIYAPVGDARCPDAEALRTLVATQLGYNPFDDSATMVVEATVTRSHGRLRGHVAIRRGAGPPGERDIDAANDCASMAGALALTISVAIDALDAAERLAPPPLPPLPSASPEVVVEAPLPPPPVPPASVVAVAPRSAPARGAPLRIRLSIAPLGVAGSTPGVAFGGAVSAGLAWSLLSVDVEGRYDLPTSSGLSSGGSVSLSTSRGALVPCAELRRIVLCAIAEVGTMRGESNGIANPVTDEGLLATAGARLGFAWHVWSFLTVRPEVEVVGALVRPELRFDGHTVWTAPPASGVLGVAAVVDLDTRAF